MGSLDEEANPMEMYRLPELPYDVAALEPHVSARVLELHHDKHHAAYVKGANAAVEALQGDVSARDLPGLQRSLAFNLAGHVLHSLQWSCMAPPAQRLARPDGDLAAAVQDDFGSYESLQARLTACLTTLQGSGWAAVVWDDFANRLQVLQLHDHQDGVVPGARTLFVVDGWEHAYYLDHANDKAAYAASFWQVADWRAAALRLTSAIDRVATST